MSGEDDVTANYSIDYSSTAELEIKTREIKVTPVGDSKTYDAEKYVYVESSYEEIDLETENTGLLTTKSQTAKVLP